MRATKILEVSIHFPSLQDELFIIALVDSFEDQKDHHQAYGVSRTPFIGMGRGKFPLEIIPINAMGQEIKGVLGIVLSKIELENSAGSGTTFLGAFD